MHIFDDEEPVEKRFNDLCQFLCIDANIKEEAWDKYKDVWANFSIDGDQLQWLVCSLYECCRRSHSDVVSDVAIDTAYVPLTRLLSTSKMSMVQFFHRIRKWADMTEMSDEMRDRIEHLERQFAISSVTFLHFSRLFPILFDSPICRSDNNELDRTSFPDLFRFIWTMFIKTRANFPAVSDDLVNSYYLLICCLDWMLGMILTSGRRDLLNLNYRGLPKDFISSSTEVSTKPFRSAFNTPPCLLRSLCEDNEINFVECKAVKESFFRPYITVLLEKDFMKLRPAGTIGFFQSDNFSKILQGLNNHYEEYIIGTGDFDERIYLSPTATQDIGSTSDQRYQDALSSRPSLSKEKTAAQGPDPLQAGACFNRPLMSCLDDSLNFSTSETRNQNLHHVVILLGGRTSFPRDTLIDLVNKYSTQGTSMFTLRTHLKLMSDMFADAYARDDSNLLPELASNSSRNELNSPVSMAVSHRLNLTQALYYLSMEKILIEESTRIGKYNAISVTDPQTKHEDGDRVKAEISSLLACNQFHKALFACSLEIVLFCCDPYRHFPWLLDSLGLDAFSLYKVSQILLKTISLPRDLLVHFTVIVEQILAIYAWSSHSSLWPLLVTASQAPTIEEVIPTEKLDKHGSPSRCDLSTAATHRGSSGAQILNTAKSGGLKVEASPIKRICLTSHKRRDVLGGSRAPSKDAIQVTPRSGTIVIKHDSTEDESARAAAQLLATDDLKDLIQLPTDSEFDPGLFPVTSSSGSLTSTPAVPVVRHDSVAIFFRHVYQMSISRLNNICDRLNLSGEIVAKIWTCFEYVIVNETHMLKDRCLDQIILCCIYGISKVSLNHPLTFVEIVQAYRMQPHSSRETYRRVLIDYISLDVSSGSQNETKVVEERGDLSRFYNVIFLPRTCHFLQQFSLLSIQVPSSANLHASQPTLSPMPSIVTSVQQTGASLQTPTSDAFVSSRRLAYNRNIFISPVKQQMNFSPKHVSFTIGQGTGKDLVELNTVISAAERRASMANLAMGLKRPSLVSGVTIATGGSPFTISSSDISSDHGSVSFGGSSGF